MKNETGKITDAVMEAFRFTMSDAQLARLRPDVETAVNKVILAHTKELLARELRPIRGGK